MRKLTKEDVTISIVPEEEDLHWTDGALGYDLSCITDFQEMVDKHGIWGWCCVKLEVQWRGLTARTYLGAASYAGETDFVENSGFYEDMVNEALDALNREVEAHIEEALDMRAELST